MISCSRIKAPGESFPGLNPGDEDVGFNKQFLLSFFGLSHYSREKSSKTMLQDSCGEPLIFRAGG